MAAGHAMTVHVYTSGDTVRLLLNGSQIATNTLTAADERKTTFTVPYASGELAAVATKNGQEIGRRTLTTTGAPAALRLTSDVEALTTGRDDLAHVLVEVLDSGGQRVPDAVVKVSFKVSGAGELAGVANANPHNVDSFKRPRRWTWHGQALAILRPAKAPGPVTLMATAQGLAPATLTLPVRPVVPQTQQQHHHHKRRRRRRALSLESLGWEPMLIAGLLGAVLKRRIQNREDQGA